ncbi:MAG: hypothetical protein OEY22_03770 [Candidatus Bathyarchaeota archaeon]|nr:hypothetical protein [Candidatus Bathyarchaeota archaeon]MDH5786853.1 hypothetical protein [Candidatus Bathyarchaeota archaeon]
MEKTLSSFRSNDGDYYLRENPAGFKCGECGEKFRKPLLATFASDTNVQKFYACPRCLTKVSDAESQKREEIKENLFPAREPKKPAAELDESVKCSHFMGYLKKRPKDSSFPDECLTCSKMIECLTS